MRSWNPAKPRSSPEVRSEILIRGWALRLALSLGAAEGLVNECHHSAKLWRTADFQTACDITMRESCLTTLEQSGHVGARVSALSWRRELKRRSLP